MKSIRVFLVIVILAIITLSSFVAALKGYQSSMAEAESLFDKQLLDTAKLIADIYSDNTQKGQSYDSTFAFQVWHQDRLLVSSFNAPAARIARLTPGFDYVNFDGYRWRTVTYFDTLKRTTVLAAERSDVRYALAENVVLESISPVLLGLPVVGFLIWLIVGQGLKPLSRLADELGKKRAGNLREISDKSYSRELKRIVLSSNQLLGRLEGSLLRESQFASDAAHELRTPISALKVQLHNLSHDFPDDNRDILKLTDTTNRLGYLVEQILDLYRSSPDQYIASLAPINLTVLTQDVLAQEYARFDEKNQELEFNSEDDCIIQGDQFALTRLLVNLLSNANKYTPNGGQIEVSASRLRDRVILKVEDSGIGIPNDEHMAVFKRFYRVGGDQHRSKEPGCGLGLAIVKRIVESHHAEISITHSRFKTGTCVQIEFPIIDAGDVSVVSDL